MSVFRNKSVNVHDFTMIPKSHVPRSVFDRESALKTAFNASDLVPIFCDEVLPGDSFNFKMDVFARLATPIVPVLDNLWFETFFFFVPNRLLWDNWRRFMGEQRNPDDSTDFILPTMTSPIGGYAIGTLQDYFGLPTVGQMVSPNTFKHTSLPLRAYNLIWNEWFRDENLQDSVVVDLDDGPDSPADYVLLKRGKRKDYFTSSLPWAQKGDPVGLPIGTQAPVGGTFTMKNPALRFPFVPTNSSSTTFVVEADPVAGAPLTHPNLISGTPSNIHAYMADISRAGWQITPGDGLYADLSDATAASVNQFRLAYQVQMLLEMDARGGTRYTELLSAHFGVNPQDSRMQRPEYLGGGKQLVTISSVEQTSGTGASGTTSPQGNLAAYGTLTAMGHGFRGSFVEHGYVIGLANVRADITYQQGVRRHWNRSTKYDFYWPAFAHLGEQAILNKEIYATGLPADDLVFGYQERWSEYRYLPSLITGRMRSTAPTPVDVWHYGEEFANLPALNSVFITDATSNVLTRTLAVGASANGVQILLDAFIKCRTVRPLPMFSTPGLIPIL